MAALLDLLGPRSRVGSALLRRTSSVKGVSGGGGGSVIVGCTVAGGTSAEESRLGSPGASGGNLNCCSCVAKGLRSIVTGPGVLGAVREPGRGRVRSGYSTEVLSGECSAPTVDGRGPAVRGPGSTLYISKQSIKIEYGSDEVPGDIKRPLAALPLFGTICKLAERACRRPGRSPTRGPAWFGLDPRPASPSPSETIETER